MTSNYDLKEGLGSRFAADPDRRPSVAHQRQARDETARNLEKHRFKMGMRFNALVTVIEVGGAIALFNVAKWMGANDVVSYLVGSIGPIAGGLVVWARSRRFSGASAAIFAFTAVSAIIAVAGSTNPKVLLYKDCAASGLVGLIFVGSRVLHRKPLVFYMAQRYGTDGTHDGMANFDAIWDTHQHFRASMRVINDLWAALFLIQAAGTAFIIREASYSIAYDADQLLPWLTVGLGIIGSIIVGRSLASRGRGAGANTAQTV